MPALSLTDWLAIAAVVALVVFNFGGTVLGWLKTLFHVGTPSKTDPAVELRTKFNLWCQMRALPDLSVDAIKYLELLKAELLKWEE